MSTSSLAGRYAQALIEIGEARDTREQIGRELSRISDLFASSDFVELFKNPQFTAKIRADVITDVLDKLVVSPTCRNFCFLLNDRNRFLLLPAIEVAYQQMNDEAAGRVRAEVVVAEALTDVEITRIRLSLQAATGKEVLVEQQLEPDIIGGVVTRLDGRVYDGSVKTQLSSLKKALIG